MSATEATELSSRVKDASNTKYTPLPQDTTIYRGEYMDMQIGGHYHHTETTIVQPKPLYYVAVNVLKPKRGQPPTPDITIYCGPDKTYPILAIINFSTRNHEVIVYNQVFNPSSHFNETKTLLTLSSALGKDVHSFEVDTKKPSEELSQPTKEKFKWVHSGDEKVRELCLDNFQGEDISQNDRGLKLVRVSNDEVIAVYAGARHSRRMNPKRVAGRLRFLNGSEEGGEWLRLTATMTILAIMEKGRQEAVSNASANTMGFEGCGGCTIL